MNGGEIEPVDIITFGSPCQDMSIAGKREGLSGSKSSLFYQAIRIIKEMRCKTNGRKPRFIVWKNVPGAFSSNKGEDFRAVIEEICKIKDESVSIPKPNKWYTAGKILGNHYSVAWRQLDAQFWGVPQRRKRIYLVADFAGRSAGKILFESESLSRYFTQSFCSWQGTAESAEAGIGEASTLVLNDQGGQRMDVLDDKTSTLRAKANHPPCVMFENHSQDTRYTGPLDVAPTVSATYGTGGNNQPFVTTAGFCTEHSSKSRGIGYEEEVSPTLRAGTVPAAMALNDTPKTLKIRSGCEGGGKGALIQDNKSATLSCNNDQTLFEPKVYGICSDGSNSMKSNNPHSGIYEADTSRTIDGNGGNPSCNQGGMAVIESFSLQGSMIGGKDEFARNLGIKEDGVAATLNAQGPSAVAWNGEKISPVEPNYTVRRLTPMECGRLQGFPDFWCENLCTENPTKEDITFWTAVFETHRKIIGESAKPKTEKQIIKWLKDPHSDSAEYKMWGNGVALPCVCFVLIGIVLFTQETAD